MTMAADYPFACRFWYQYSNINALVAELGIEDPFTQWTRSSFWAPDGLQAGPYSSNPHSFGKSVTLYALGNLMR